MLYTKTLVINLRLIRLRKRYKNELIFGNNNIDSSLRYIENFKDLKKKKNWEHFKLYSQRVKIILQVETRDSTVSYRVSR